MGRKSLAILMGLGLAGAGITGNLYGIHSGLSGFQLAKISSSTGAVEVLATLPLSGLSVVNQMTYHWGRQKFVVTGTVSNLEAYLFEIDPVTFLTTSVSHTIPTTYVEGIEYLPISQILVVSYGGPTLTTKVARLDSNYQMTGFGELVIPELDMDTIYTDQTGAVFKMDVTHFIAGTPFARIFNPFTAISHVPIGWDYGSNFTDFDVAYHPGDGRLYLTRGTSLAYLNSARTQLTPVGSYGGFNITALAFGPETKSLQGTLVLSDTQSSFAEPRSIVYSLSQGTITIASGSLAPAVSSSAFSIPVLDNITGPATLTFDGSSFLKRTVNVTLTGNSVLVGSVTMTNGDPDFSGEVDAADIDLVIANFGNAFPGPTGSTHADVDCSGEVDAADIDIVIANFGETDT